MLYKKTHRQFLREFREDRRFRYSGGNVFEITKKPQIDRYYIYISIDKRLYNYNILRLIPLTLLGKGRLWGKKEIKWLED